MKQVIKLFTINHHLYADNTQLQKTHALCCNSNQSSDFDYCNSEFAGLPDTTLSSLRRVMNAVIRLVAGLGPRDLVMVVMRELHWLPISFRIKYKLYCLLMHAAVNSFCPVYICKVLFPVFVLPVRAALWSSTSGTFDVPRTRTELWKRVFFQWLDLQHGTVYLLVLDRLRTLGRQFKPSLTAPLYSVANNI